MEVVFLFVEYSFRVDFNSAQALEGTCHGCVIVALRFSPSVLFLQSSELIRCEGRQRLLYF